MLRRLAKKTGIGRLYRKGARMLRAVSGSAAIRDSIRGRTGQSRLWLLLDLLYCAWRYDIAAEDYELYEFYRLNHAGRREYIGFFEIDGIRGKLQDAGYERYFRDKRLFNDTFGAYVGRGWLYAPDHTDEEILRFVRELHTVFIKPVDSNQGRGIFKTEFDDIGDHDKFCETARQNKYLIEEAIIQHPALAAVNPNSVNSLRINTILDKSGTPRFISAVLRCSANTSVIDNKSQGGIVTGVDLESGILLANSTDKSGERYMRHPYTGVVMPGIQIPMWNTVLDMLREASRIIPQVRLVAWDVAITEKGPVLIEGNHQGGPWIMQHGAVGVKKMILKYI